MHINVSKVGDIQLKKTPKIVKLCCENMKNINFNEVFQKKTIIEISAIILF